MNAVNVEGLTVRYSGARAIDNVNFSVKDNDLLAIIGPNGAGKSTLFACMLGLITRYDGRIEFFDQDIKRSRRYLKQIGYVPQKPAIEQNFPATVREVVSMGMTHGSRERVDRVLQDVLIHELSGRRIGELSGGQLQRVFIAKALVNNPRLLILDEPVTGIDSQSTELFYGILRDLNKKHGITIIWSSHDMGAISRLATKIVCLNCTLFFHGESGDFFTNKELVRKYSEASMREHAHHN